MKQSDAHKLLDEVLKVRDGGQVRAVLASLLARNHSQSLVLTIVANAGLHKIPDAYLRGEVYEASRGDWDASDEKALLHELTTILSRLANKLRSRRWKYVYLIPTGHPVLSLQIKAMVYRLLRFNTIDLYHKAGTYIEVNLDHRKIGLSASEPA